MFVKKKITWNEMISSYITHPRDVKTVPLNGTGRWFYVYVEDGNIYVENAQYHSFSSRINGRRALEKDKMEDILSLYFRRKKGESISQEATDATKNQVYWYGIFADMCI